jgi:DNA-binding transcriptional ArsR family regulator
LYKTLFVQVKLETNRLSPYDRPVSADAAFAALADRRRRDMLRLVRDTPRSVNEIAKHFDITQQAVSHHLKVLHDAGLVGVQPQGQRRLYLVRPEGLQGLDAFLSELWPQGLQRLKQAVERDARR